MKRLATIAAAAALLGGCGMGSSDVRPAMCGWLAEYPPAFQARAADELDRLGEGTALGVLIDDYGELRARIRAACAR